MFRSFHLSPGRTNAVNGTLKMSLLTEWMSQSAHSLDLSFVQRVAAILMSLLSLLTTHEHGQETGAGRVLPSITPPAGADQP